MLKLYYTGLLPRGSVEVSFDNGNSYVEKTLAELKEGVDIGNADTADIKIKVANANTDDLVAGNQLEIGENEIVIKNVDIKQDTVKIGDQNVPKSNLSETNGLYYFEGPSGDGRLNFGETAYWSDSRGALRKAEFTEIEDSGHYTSNFDNNVYATGNDGIEITSGHSLAEGFTGYSINSDRYMVLDKNNETVSVSTHEFVSPKDSLHGVSYFEDDEKEPVFFEFSSGSWSSGRAQDASYVEGAKELDWYIDSSSFYAYFTKDENGFNNIEFTSTDLTPTEGADRVYESNYNEDYYFEGNSSGQIINSYPKSEYVDPNAEEENN